MGFMKSIAYNISDVFFRSERDHVTRAHVDRENMIPKIAINWNCIV